MSQIRVFATFVSLGVTNQPAFPSLSKLGVMGKLMCANFSKNLGSIDA